MVLEISCCYSHVSKNQIMHRILNEGRQEFFENFKFSRKLLIILIPFIVLSKNQHAHGKEMTIIMHSMHK